MINVDTIMARQIDSCANTISGLGEHGLANQLWALAGKLRERARGDRAQAPDHYDRQGTN